MAGRGVSRPGAAAELAQCRLSCGQAPGHRCSSQHGRGGHSMGWHLGPGSGPGFAVLSLSCQLAWTTRRGVLSLGSLCLVSGLRAWEPPRAEQARTRHLQRSAGLGYPPWQDLALSPGEIWTCVWVAPEADSGTGTQMRPVRRLSQALWSRAGVAGTARRPAPTLGLLTRPARGCYPSRAPEGARARLPGVCSVGMSGRAPPREREAWALILHAVPGRAVFSLCRLPKAGVTGETAGPEEAEELDRNRHWGWEGPCGQARDRHWKWRWREQRLSGHLWTFWLRFC